MGIFTHLCKMYTYTDTIVPYILCEVLALHGVPNGPPMFTYLQETTEGVISYAIKILCLVSPSRFGQLPFIAIRVTIHGNWLNRLFTLVIT